MFQCLPGLYIAVFDKSGQEAKYDPLTRFALMALARKNRTDAISRGLFRIVSIALPTLETRTDLTIARY